MSVRKFNDNFYKFRKEPQVQGTVSVTQSPYEGYGDRWYMDVTFGGVHPEVEMCYSFLIKSCPTSEFDDGPVLKVKIPKMKGEFTYDHNHPRPLTKIDRGETLDVTIRCAGMFLQHGIWKPSWKLSSLDIPSGLP